MSVETHHAVVHFTGRVQGVGFRYQTLQVAKEFTVTGYVMNLPDGRVRLEVEGEESEVEEFLGALEERMNGYIRKTERSLGRRFAQFRDFSIR
jgi:acylphosphatase